MYGKIFESIYNSSIAEDWQTRLVFMDLIVLADSTGVVDMTHEAISRRTNVPLDVIRKAIANLEGPDPRSRNPEANGVRIVRLDAHRDWGWFILNHKHYMDMVDMEDYRRKNRERQARYRERHKNVDVNTGKELSDSINSSNVTVTLRNGGVTRNNDTETETETETKTEETTPIPPYQGAGGEKTVRSKPTSRLSAVEKKTAKYQGVLTEEMKAIGRWFHRRENTPWTIAEAERFKALGPLSDEDMSTMFDYYTAEIGEDDFRRRDVITLLNNWASELDRARHWLAEHEPKFGEPGWLPSEEYAEWALTGKGERPPT